MRRRQFIAGLGTSVACPIMSFAQQPAKVARIGWLTAQRAESPRAVCGRISRKPRRSWLC